MEKETDLQKLVNEMNVTHHKGIYVYCAVPFDFQFPISEVIATFKESEGLTLILREEIAMKMQLSFSFRAAWITLQVYSSLEAIGFTAFFSNALAKNGIACNVISAYHHDHLFVPHQNARDVVKILNSLNLKS